MRISRNGAMRRNGARFALLSVSKRGYQTLLLRLSAVLRNAVAMCRPLITPDNRWHKTTWPEFQPSLPPGREGEDGFDDEIGDAESHHDARHDARYLILPPCLVRLPQLPPRHCPPISGY